MIHFSHLMAACVVALLAQAMPASAAIVINNVTIIDGTGRPPEAGRSVLIDGDHIAEIRDHLIKTPAGATVIDGRGKFLMPGMGDTHIHLGGGRPMGGGAPISDMAAGQRILHGYLYNGITFVYDANNYDKYIFAMRDAERSGRMVSPRIFATGFAMTWTGGYISGGTTPTLNTYEQGTKILDELLPEKPDLVKFLYAPHNLDDPKEIPSFDPTTLHRLILYAQERGFRTTAHAVELGTQRAAVEAGIDSLAHPVYATETDDKLAPLIATKGIPVSTSLAVIESIFKPVDDPHFFEAPGFRDILSPEDLARFGNMVAKSSQSAHNVEWSRKIMGYAQTSDRKLYDAGAILAVGTDTTIAEFVHRELELLVGIGIPPLQVLRIATLNAATYLHKQDVMGSVKEGKLADLVLLNADPTQDIGNVRKISMVILGGKIIDRTKLDLPINHPTAGK